MAMINTSKIGQAMQADTNARQQTAERLSQELAAKEEADSAQTMAKAGGAAQGALAGAASGAALGAAGGPLAFLTVPGGAIAGGLLGGISGWMGSGNQTQQAANSLHALDQQYRQSQIPKVNIGSAPQIQPLQAPTSFGVG